MKIAYVTAGTVGAGHLVRGLAIQEGLRRGGIQAEYRIFGPSVQFSSIPLDNYTEIPIKMEELADHESASQSQLAQALTEFRPDLVLVDLFWAPLRYILPIADAEAWLLVRRCPSVWFRGPRAATYDETQYTRVIAIEPFKHDLLTDKLDPIVICNPDECHPRRALKERLSISPRNRLTVVTHAGDSGEWIELAKGTHSAMVFDLYDQNAFFPLAKWLGGADEIVSGAGYNSFWEAQWLGYADRVHFHPFDRPIDDQIWRVTRCKNATPQSNGADELARWIGDTFG